LQEGLEFQLAELADDDKVVFPFLGLERRLLLLRSQSRLIQSGIRFGEQSQLVQFRLEAYNVLNTLQFRNVDRGARFDAAGNQVNANFGTANQARNPRIMQASLRFTF